MQSSHGAGMRPLNKSPTAVQPTSRIQRCKLARCRVFAAVTNPTRDCVKEFKHLLPDGKRLELLSVPAATPCGRPPLLFLHGSYHAAWCWKEHFMPYFSEAGYDCTAVSMRGQGGSDPVQGAVAGTLDSHAADLASVVASITDRSAAGDAAPVLVSHSFGGLVAQKYILNMEPPHGSGGNGGGSGSGSGRYPALAGVAYLASVPPSGNKQLVGRYFKRDVMLSLRLTWAFIAKSFATNSGACRETFFSADLPEPTLLRYQAALAACSPTRLLDLRDVNAQVPLPPPPPYAPASFVLGAADDKIVDAEAVAELAAYCGTSPVTLPALAHDVMLDTRWQECALALRQWLDTLPAAAL